jgi:hypothetical protein
MHGGGGQTSHACLFFKTFTCCNFTFTWQYGQKPLNALGSCPGDVTYLNALLAISSRATRETFHESLITVRDS